MEKFKLAPHIDNPVVECQQLNLPIEKNIDLQIVDGYTTPDGKHRYLHSGGISDATVKYFRDIFYYKVTPLLFSHPNFFNTWPIVPRTVLEKTDITITVFKDEIGWYQPEHEDPKVFFCSGVIHLQDCEQGTTFVNSPDKIYTAPTQKGYGAFWLNSHVSKHHVPIVTKERMGYLLMIRWTALEPFNFTGKAYGAGDSFMIDFDDFYR
jgi:hypothetical protein